MAQSPTQEASQSSPTAAARPIENANDLTAFVDSLLQEMQDRFQQLGSKINGRMDELGKRIDELEQHVSELADDAGIDKQTILNNGNHRPNSLNGAAAASPPPAPPLGIPRSPVPPSSSGKAKATSTQIEI
ncbi:hypothetical protein MPSEU_000694800 [Mayamaea pseudoterrestris]|nr:hypothetical protein MPSEU_000694800 [Mayamaea pseudoterrestris]